MVNSERQVIALISDYADPAEEIDMEEAGGQNIYVREMGESLAALGWQVDIFTRKSHPNDPAIVQHSPHCRTIRLQAGPETFIPRDQLFDYMPDFLASFQAFQAKNAVRYPLVHTNYWLSGWVGLQLQQQNNAQLIHTYHSLGAVKYDTMTSKPAIAETRLVIESEILAKADCILATSPQEKETLCDLLSETGRIEVIPCGTTANFHRFPKKVAREKLGWAEQDKILLYVGRFAPRKGIETLVKSCAELKQRKVENLKLVIVGGSSLDRLDGPERHRIEQLVEALELQDQTDFAGRIDHDWLPWYYSAADVCVIPSYYEPFGLVAIEAIACGTPVVASKVGGLRFTIQPEETGLLVPPKDEMALADAIEQVLGDEAWATKLKKQASSGMNQRFSWQNSALQVSDLYRYILARSIMHDQPWNPKVSRLRTVSEMALTDVAAV